MPVLSNGVAMKYIIAHQFIDGFIGNPHFPAEQRLWLEILVFVEAVPSRFGFNQIPFRMWLIYIVQQRSGTRRVRISNIERRILKLGLLHET
jgi:hypothetical protein